VSVPIRARAACAALRVLVREEHHNASLKLLILATIGAGFGDYLDIAGLTVVAVVITGVALLVMATHAAGCRPCPRSARSVRATQRSAPQGARHE
jgi:hypothetical protein